MKKLPQATAANDLAIRALSQSEIDAVTGAHICVAGGPLVGLIAAVGDALLTIGKLADLIRK